MKMIKLKTKAITNWDNDKQSNLPVELSNEGKGWILTIKGSGGSWYMESLIGVGEMIFIDMGADYKCINFGDILKEASDKLLA